MINWLIDGVAQPMWHRKYYVQDEPTLAKQPTSGHLVYYSIQCWSAVIHLTMLNMHLCSQKSHVANSQYQKVWVHVLDAWFVHCWEKNRPKGHTRRTYRGTHGSQNHYESVLHLAGPHVRIKLYQNYLIILKTDSSGRKKYIPLALDPAFFVN